MSQTLEGAPTGQVTAVHAETANQSKCLMEVAEILAFGLMRLYAPKSSQVSADSRESSLDFTPTKSGHPTQLGIGED